MSDYSKQIRRITAERTALLDTIDQALKDLGSLTVELPAGEQPETLKSLVEDYERIRDGIEKASSAIERLMDIDTRQEELKQRMKTLRTERDELGRGLTGVYEQIGAVAFRLFRESPLIDAGYSSAFEALARYQDEVRSIENKLDNLNQGHEEKGRLGFLERLRTGGKDVYLRNRRNARENRLPRLLQSTGEQLAEGDFISQVDDEELNRVSEPLRNVRKRWDEIDTELQELARESGRLVEEFNDLSGGRGLSRARSAHETEIARLRDQLNGVFLTIGKEVEELNLDRFSERLSRLEVLRQEVAEKDTLLSRLYAGQQMETVSKELAACGKQQEKIRNDIEQLESRLRKLREEESALQSQLQQLESERGDPAELFEY